MSASMQVLRKLALRHPGVDEGVACAGTALERRTVKVRGKAFLFLGAGDAMLKLAASLPEAAAWARRQPQAVRVGAGGWVKVTFADHAPSAQLFETWIAESYALAADSATAKPKASKGAAKPKQATAKPTKAAAKPKQVAAKPTKAAAKPKPAAAKPAKAAKSSVVGKKPTPRSRRAPA
jgi:hypothetical protein